MERERLGSRLGFILLSAGCAIGVGNVWKFPWLCGQNGGGAFVVLYIFFLIILGLPAMTMEFAVGRASRASIVGIYPKLAKAGTKWHWHGLVALAGNIILMGFYTVVSGWMLYYFYATLKGDFSTMGSEELGKAFGALCSDPVTLIVSMVVIIVLGFFVLSFSLQGGLERVTKVMMIALLVIMVALAVKGFTMEGSKEGLSFYLIPDFSKLTWPVVVSAMNQAFFTLSLGMGSMAIFGSYMSKERSLMGESVNVMFLDTFVAIVAGLIIFPTCFTYGIEPGAGPSLIFVTLPNIFNNMAGGRIWGSLFFLFMAFAAFSTVLAVFETILSAIRELTGWDRKKASLVCCIGIILIALPAALGFNLLSNIHPFGGETNIMDLEDFLVSNLILPLGSLVFVLFCTRSKSFGWDKYIAEANTGKGLKVRNWMRWYCSYILPVIIVVIFIIGIVNFFNK